MRSKGPTPGARTSSSGTSFTASARTGSRGPGSSWRRAPIGRFTPYDRFAQFRESAGKPLAGLLDEFAHLRAANVAILREWNLSDEQLALSGEHPEFGAVTLRQLLATWVAHDLSHLAQMTRVMAKQYRDAVGPWRAYLPIMDR